MSYAFLHCLCGVDKVRAELFRPLYRDNEAGMRKIFTLHYCNIAFLYLCIFTINLHDNCVL